MLPAPKAGKGCLSAAYCVVPPAKQGVHVQVAETKAHAVKPAESSSNNVEKDDSPGQENRTTPYNVMPAPLPSATPKLDYSKLDSSQIAGLLKACRQELQQGRQEIQRQNPMVSLQELSRRAAGRTSLNKSKVTATCHHLRSFSGHLQMYLFQSCYLLGWAILLLSMLPMMV